MFKLPVVIVMFLPKKYQDLQIKMRWDSFTDKEILDYYADGVKWIKALDDLYGKEKSLIRDRFQKHLDDLVIPQMKQRKLI